MPNIRTDDLPRSVRLALENAEAEAQRRADEEAALIDTYRDSDSAHLAAFDRLFIAD